MSCGTLLIPRTGSIKESLYQLAHDPTGHFSSYKTYALLRDGFYWPNMRKDLEQVYILSCPECQRNKGRTIKPPGLHPLPILEQRGDSVVIDFVGPLPQDVKKSCILTMTERLGSGTSTRTDISAEGLFMLILPFQHYG